MAKDKLDFKSVWQVAKANGIAAGDAATPRPMTVVGMGEEYNVPDGLCGFASVRFRPATQPIVKWLKAMGIGYKSSQGGWVVSIREHNQSVARKEAHAQAMVKTLKEHGIECSWESNLD